MDSNARRNAGLTQEQAAEQLYIRSLAEYEAGRTILPDKGVKILKQEKRLQRWMKKLLKEKGLNPRNWYYIKNTPQELVIIHRHSLRPRTIKKEILKKGA